MHIEDEDIVGEDATMLLDNLLDVVGVLQDAMAAVELMMLIAITEETGALLDVML